MGNFDEIISFRNVINKNAALKHNSNSKFVEILEKEFSYNIDFKYFTNIKNPKFKLLTSYYFKGVDLFCEEITNKLEIIKNHPILFLNINPFYLFAEEKQIELSSSKK